MGVGVGRDGVGVGVGEGTGVSVGVGDAVGVGDGVAVKVGVEATNVGGITVLSATTGPGGPPDVDVTKSMAATSPSAATTRIPRAIMIYTQTGHPRN